MSDVLEQLHHPPFGTETSERLLMERAADEIARLRAELAAAQGNSDDNYKKLMECRADLAAEREKTFTAMRVFERYRELEATIAKLREALEPFAAKLAYYNADASDEYPCDFGDFRLADLRRARAVLEETEGKGDA